MPKDGSNKRAVPSVLERRQEWVDNWLIRWTLFVLFVTVAVFTIVFAVLIAWPDLNPTSSTNCSTVTTYAPVEPSSASPNPTPPLAETEKVVDCGEQELPVWVLALGPVLMALFIAPEIISFYGSVSLSGQVGDLPWKLSLARDRASDEAVQEVKRGVKKRSGDFKKKFQSSSDG